MSRTINFRWEICQGCGKGFNGNDHNQGLNHAKSCSGLKSDKFFADNPEFINDLKRRLGMIEMEKFSKKEHKTYPIRAFNEALNKIEVVQVNMKQRVFDCLALQLNMEDVGLVLLNERRKQYYLEPITLNLATGTYE